MVQLAPILADPERVALRKAFISAKSDLAPNDPLIDTQTREEIRIERDKEMQAEAVDMVIIEDAIQAAVENVRRRMDVAINDVTSAAAGSTILSELVEKAEARMAEAAKAAEEAAASLDPAASGVKGKPSLILASKSTLGRKPEFTGFRPFSLPTNQTPSGTEQVLEVL